MELPNPLFPNKTHFSSLNLSPFTPRFPTNNPHRFYLTSSKSRKSPSIPFHLRSSTTGCLLVSASHFGGPTSRRNSLRKKLIDDQQVRLEKLISLDPSSSGFRNPDHEFGDVKDSVENFGGYASIREGEASCDGVNVNTSLVESEGVKTGAEKQKAETLGASASLRKLENWVDQYKKDSAYWGIGSNPIFTVYEDSDGSVKRVLVDEGEILRRSGVDQREFDGSTGVNLKILYAKSLARDMEGGGDVIPRSSSVAKFVVSEKESGVISMVHGVVTRPEFIPVLSGIGRLVFCGVVAIWAAKKLLNFGDKEERLTELEKEMMRRKIKSRKEKEMLEKSSVEVVQKQEEPPAVAIQRPKLDREELMKNIFEAKGSRNKLALKDSSSSHVSKTKDLQIQEIRVMARQAREMKSGERSLIGKDGVENWLLNEKPSSGIQEVKENTGEVMRLPDVCQNSDSYESLDVYGSKSIASIDRCKSDESGYNSKLSSEEHRVLQASASISTGDVSKDIKTRVEGGVIRFSDTPNGNSYESNKGPIRKKPRVIRSVKEAREFLAKKADKDQELPLIRGEERNSRLRLPGDKIPGSKTSQYAEMSGKMHKPLSLNGTSDSLPSVGICEDSSPKVMKLGITTNDGCKDSENGYGVHDTQKPYGNGHVGGSSGEKLETVNSENWMEENFDKVEPIVKKIGDGFRQNYTVARGKANELANKDSGITDFDFNGDDSELDWMKDDSLREIVFQVRENELAGRDPFYLMDAEDKIKFFEGLEKKVEAENKKLYQVHEYLHANIENLDYGADGISLYDPPEKIIPRWKGPPLEKTPDFLNSFREQRNSMLSGNAGTPFSVKEDEDILLQKSTTSGINQKMATASADSAWKKSSPVKDPKDSKMVIEGSDGSIKAGKKSGKEYWQHTKKWSRGFLESYNAETNPEVKAIMKDIGKDLDRWITEKEIQEAADMMDKLPERNKKFIESKISKLKREMELFGPQAVVSKYREYAEDKEEDYLWWLDLPHVLCIELYTIEDGEQKIGFYSLEMAADLELDPKPCHVIAIEDAGDCKNLCYIIQAHMDMLGIGHAFVVPRPPKDAFREAKANGFSVTVIRKGELRLNVDQPLEEVEEQIAEIGSKIYHDKLMQERSVDINSLTKGVFGFSGQSASSKRKRSNRKLKKPTKTGR